METIKDQSKRTRPILDVDLDRNRRYFDKLNFTLISGTPQKKTGMYSHISDYTTKINGIIQKILIPFFTFFKKSHLIDHHKLRK